jgi:hypothetical protein
MIHVPLTAVPSDHKLGEVCDSARQRYRRTRHTGFDAALPIVAYEVKDRELLDPARRIPFQISEEPERLVIIGLEQTYGDFVVEIAQETGASCPGMMPTRGKSVVSRQTDLLLPGPKQRLREIYAVMRAKECRILAWSMPTGKKKVPAVGIVLLDGREVVAEMRRRMGLDAQKTLTFLCSPVLAMSPWAG